VNILIGSNIGLRVADLAEMGARRISVGSSLFRSAWTGFVRAAELIAREGNFAGFDHTVPFADINKFFSNLC
jgi:2-methylisocitrate lyase-like PEP mutase family enzyme